MGSLKLCEQIDDTGCGIACVSMISNKKYHEVKSLLMELQGWKKPNRNLYTKATDLAPLLQKYGIKAEIKKSGTWDEVSGVSIVGVDREDGYFHWVISIKDEKRFLIIDPKHGEVLNGKKAISRKRYKQGKGRSNYLYISTTINTIKI